MTDSTPSLIVKIDKFDFLFLIRPDSIRTKQAANKATGIVTTTRVTHATPAGTFAHTSNRDWSDMLITLTQQAVFINSVFVYREDDYAMSFDGVDPVVCSDIAEQLVESTPGKNFKVIMGGARTYFLPNTVNDVETGRGRRRDGKNLVDQWQAANPTGSYVTSVQQLLALNLTRTEKILGN